MPTPCVATPAASCDPSRLLDVSAHHIDAQGPHLSAGLPRAPLCPLRAPPEVAVPLALSLAFSVSPA